MLFNFINTISKYFVRFDRVYNNYGQLGLNDTTRNTFTKVNNI